MTHTKPSVNRFLLIQPKREIGKTERPLNVKATILKIGQIKENSHRSTDQKTNNTKVFDREYKRNFEGGEGKATLNATLFFIITMAPPPYGRSIKATILAPLYILLTFNL
ncbi:hypothetical protein A3754_13475 [Alcanivorax sp. HI0083]|uniref:hypothetical protein n=1 Tax=unclassified Alcanivorax TaxID=2638842 RepID=UPI0007B876DA|nr:MULTISPECIES: hypothetical protein [unclassified Alcanivorax]KZY32106.1 hypothetical protein A3730_18855 [Alcanivorax sp. HI0044]KZY38633.1 hypothetical protein A3730_25110 [Alcanivorax sp. HI0044]KZZ25712.1 hypothetical protein A3754_13475 [Alcanivorax sp. HI0083]